MKQCDFSPDCYFLNVKTVTLPFTTWQAKTDYCQGNFCNCAIYKTARIHGIDKVPRYVSPEDRYELQSRIIENAPLGSLCR